MYAMCCVTRWPRVNVKYMGSYDSLQSDLNLHIGACKNEVCRRGPDGNATTNLG
jgi:hypothetical protein